MEPNQLLIKNIFAIKKKKRESKEVGIEDLGFVLEIWNTYWARCIWSISMFTNSTLYFYSSPQRKGINDISKRKSKLLNKKQAKWI